MSPSSALLTLILLVSAFSTSSSATALAFPAPSHISPAYGVSGEIRGPSQPLQPSQQPCSPDLHYYYGCLVPPRELVYFEANAYGIGTKLKFNISASYTLDVYVMSNTQYSALASSGSTAALYHWTTATASEVVSLPSSGQYYLIVWNDISGTTEPFELSYSTIPVDIYQGYSSPPAPVGITDYGVKNSSNALLPYEVLASQVTGSAVINSVAAYNNSAPSPYGAGLQLNVMLGVNTTTGQYVYWLQNVLRLFTNNNTAFFLSNIWNASSGVHVLDQSYISPSSHVYQSGSENFYATPTNRSQYTTPLTVRMTVAVTHSGSSAKISFGYEESQNGLPLSGKTVYYDNATISESHSVQNAAIVINGYERTPDDRFFDAEFVFAGDCCLISTTFNNMDSTLNLYYTLENGQVTVPMSVYEFGSNTGEAAYNLRTSMVQGKFQVSLGQVDFGANYIPVSVASVNLSSAIRSWMEQPFRRRRCSITSVTGMT